MHFAANLFSKFKHVAVPRLDPGFLSLRVQSGGRGQGMRMVSKPISYACCDDCQSVSLFAKCGNMLNLRLQVVASPRQYNLITCQKFSGSMFRLGE